MSTTPSGEDSALAGDIDAEETALLGDETANQASAQEEKDLDNNTPAIVGDQERMRDDSMTHPSNTKADRIAAESGGHQNSNDDQNNNSIGQLSIADSDEDDSETLVSEHSRGMLFDMPARTSSFTIPDAFLSTDYMKDTSISASTRQYLQSDSSKQAGTGIAELSEDVERQSISTQEHVLLAQKSAAEAEALARELKKAQKAARKAEKEADAQREHLDESRRVAEERRLEADEEVLRAEQAKAQNVVAQLKVAEKKFESDMVDDDKHADLKESLISKADSFVNTRGGDELARLNLSNLAVPLLQHLEDIVEKNTDDIFATFYEADGKATKTMTYGKIWEDAGTISSCLRNTWNVDKGEHVVLCLGYGLSYISAWLGCLRAGVVPIIVASPVPPFDNALTRMNLVMKAASPIALVLTDSVVAFWKETDQSDRDSSSRLMWPMDTPWKVVDKVVSKQPRSSLPKAAEGSMFQRTPATPTQTSPPRPPIVSKQRSSPSFIWASPAVSTEEETSFDDSSLNMDDVACLQHTSGSTGDPKVVAITFAALYEAIRLTQLSLPTIFTNGVAQEGFSWLPPDHHLGLFLGMLCPFASGCRMHYMSSLTYEQMPLQWIELLSRYKIAWTAAPDPAYRWLMRSFESLDQEHKNRLQLDLSKLQHLLNIGEATRFDTQSRFRNLFGPYRLHKECGFTTGYGLAEHILAVSWVSGEFVVVPTTLNVSATNWVAVARRSALPQGVEIVVVDTSTKTPTASGQMGEVWVHSPCIKSLGKGGYHKNKKLSRKIFQGRLKGSKLKFLRTGDLGFWDIDYLYICGRKKDAMANRKDVIYYPPDLEWVVEDARPEIRPGCVAAFSSVRGTVEVVFEVLSSESGETVKSVCQDVFKALKDTTGIKVSSVIAVPERSIPKTHAGLVERRITKAMILKDQITVLCNFAGRQEKVSLLDIENLLETRATPEAQPISKKASRGSSRGSRGLDSYSERSLANLQDAEIDNILSRYVGNGFDNEMSWEELGLTSTTGVLMSRDLGASMFVAMPPNCFEHYPTPASVKEYISETSGVPLMTDALYLKLRGKSLPWILVGLYQTLLTGFIIVLFSVPIIPCWLVFELLQPYEHLLLLMVPLWMLTFSLITIVAKWLVVGRYKEGRFVTPSCQYLRWWFIDRLVDLWEVWVGQFIMETPFLFWFYTLMGAKLHPSCQLAGFIREFDLFTMGNNSSLKYHSTVCRKFSSWESFERGPVMAFRPISIGDNSTVRGMLCPGVKVGENVDIQKLSVVPEGASIEDNVEVAGNPAFIADAKDPLEALQYFFWIEASLFKMVWVVVELCLLYGIWKGAEFINASPDVDTGTVDYWILFGATVILLSLLSSIIIKLLLVGHRSPGKLSSYWCYHPADWAADYHFLLVTLPFRIFAKNSRLSNLILKLHGMNIDFISSVEMESFPPSKMDLVRVRRSFIGKVTFDVKSDGIFHSTIIEDSSLGQFSHVSPGLDIMKSKIPPISHIRESIMEDSLKKKDQMEHSLTLYASEICIILFDLVVLAAVLLTIVPAYLTWTLSMDYVSPITAAPILAASLVAQSISWFLVFLLVNTMAFLGVTKKRAKPWFPCLHPIYRNCSDTYHEWSFIRLTWGSPMFNVLARLLGASFAGRFLYFGEKIYDFPLVSAATRTVVDGATVVAHNIMYERTRFGRSRISGVLRQNTFVMADAELYRKESGPWHAVAGSATSGRRKSTTSSRKSPVTRLPSGGALDEET